MAAHGFAKESKERKMFLDLWELCQEYWIPEKTEEYWQSLVDAVDQFNEKHPGELAAKWIYAFVSCKEKEVQKLDRS